MKPIRHLTSATCVGRNMPKPVSDLQQDTWSLDV
jgi:hypothetical protein